MSIIKNFKNVNDNFERNFQHFFYDFDKNFKIKKIEKIANLK